MEYRGAYATIQDTFPDGSLEGEPIQGIYFSFGEWNEEKDCDSFGVPDDHIFYYCDGGEQELKDLCKPAVGCDWYVIDYELIPA